ncbi:MAG: PhoP regulatory network YrbL family protein [Opitutaceae bacterium]|nr:PhoP regulatory network YrbL family protein [Opitutaceae bacterium]
MKTDAAMSDAGGEPLRLAGLAPFGVGGRRRCFVHPDFPGRCVKVARADGTTMLQPKKSGWRPAWTQRVYDNNADELNELGKLRRMLGDETMARHFPRLYGMVATDLGPGLVMDLVRDADGRISQTLREQLSEGNELGKYREAYDEFGRFLLGHGIVTRDLLDHNLAVRRGEGGEFRFYLIDGFGDAAWFAPGRWIPAIDRRRIRKKITRGWARFERVAAEMADPEQAKAALRWKLGMLRHR